LSTVRYLLLLLAACVLCAMLSLAPSQSTVQAQSQDPTLSSIEADRLRLEADRQRRLSELAAIRAAQEAAARQATAVRQMTVQAQNDQATATAQAMAATTTNDARMFGLTATAAAWEAQHTATARAEATQIAATVMAATATRSAEATGTAMVQATQDAQGTATREAAVSTADAMAFAEQVRRQEEQYRLEAEQRQRLINQGRQAVYVIGGLVLVVLAGGLLYFSLRLIWAWVARPVQIVEFVPPDERPLTAAEVREEVEQVRPPIWVTVDTVEGAQQMYDYLRREGIAPACAGVPAQTGAPVSTGAPMEMETA